jgi:hypothetical protein
VQLEVELTQTMYSVKTITFARAYQNGLQDTVTLRIVTLRIVTHTEQSVMKQSVTITGDQKSQMLKCFKSLIPDRKVKVLKIKRKSMSGILMVYHPSKTLCCDQERLLES